MSNNKYTEDDYCDLIPGGKICDNCGKCLEEAGVDIRAIKIEDIAKNVEENKFIEEELKKAMDTALDLHIESNEKEYSVDLENYLEEDYVDAFENIVYLDLLRRGYEVHIGKVGDAEVDFIAINSEGQEYYQVAQTVMDEQTLKRELSSLDSIKDHNPKYLLTMDFMPLTSYNGIKQINIIEWLLR